MPRFPMAMWAVLALVLAGPAGADEPPAKAPGLAGTWAVDIARLPMAPEARPRSVTITFAGLGDGRWSTSVVVVDAQGATLKAEGINRLDGSVAPVTGGFEADAGAARMPVPGVLVLQLSRGGVPGSTRIYTLAPGGEAMVETAAYFDDEGRPVMREHYFTRVH